MKKILSIMLSLVMLLALSVPAFAAEGDPTGTITVTNATIGKEYAGYKIFDATFADEDTASYTIKTDNQFYDDVVASGVFTLTPSATDNTVMVVGFADGKDNRDALNWVKNLSTAGKTADLAAQTATSTTVEWTGVADGYYLITTTLGTAVTVTNAGNITVIDKNDGPHWDPENPDPENPGTPDDGTASGKFVKDSEDNWVKQNSAHVGETVDFMINAYAPLFNGEKLVTEYTFTDTLDEAFEFDANSLVVTANGDTTLVKDVDYVLTSTTNGFTVKLTVDATEDAANYQWATDTHLSITYSAVLTKDAAHVNNNDADMTWKETTPDPKDPTVPNNPTEDPTDPPTGDVPPTSSTETLTFGINLIKVDANDHTKILDAEFKLYDALTEGNEIVLVEDDEHDGYDYRVATDEEKAAANFEAATIAAGDVKIFGLAAGTYYLEETNAPAGYNILTARVAVTVGEEVTIPGEEGQEPTTVVPEYTKAEVENNSGTLLPSTGGIGTTIFYVLGSILCAGAVILLIVKRRMQAEI